MKDKVKTMQEVSNLMYEYGFFYNTDGYQRGLCLKTGEPLGTYKFLRYIDDEDKQINNVSGTPALEWLANNVSGTPALEWLANKVSDECFLSAGCLDADEMEGLLPHIDFSISGDWKRRQEERKDHKYILDSIKECNPDFVMHESVLYKIVDGNVFEAKPQEFPIGSKPFNLNRLDFDFSISELRKLLDGGDNLVNEYEADYQALKKEWDNIKVYNRKKNPFIDLGYDY